MTTALSATAASSPTTASTRDGDRSSSLRRLVRIDMLVALAAFAVIVAVTAIDHASRSPLWSVALLAS